MIKRILSVFLTVLLVAGLVMVPAMSVSADEFETIDTSDYVPDPATKPANLATIASWDDGILGIDVTKNSPSYPYVTVTAPSALDTNEQGIFQSQLNTPCLGAMFSITSGTLTAGKSYVLSYKVRNNNPSVDATVVSSIVDGTGAMSKNNVFTDVITGSEQQTLVRTITLASTDTQTTKTYLRIGLGISNTHNWFKTREDLAFVPNSEIVYDYANIYFAEETAYDIENTLSSTKTLPGSTVTGNAKIVNQLGEKGNLDQTMTYFVTDESGVIAEGFTVTPGEDGAYEVAVGDSVADGNYVVLARSSAYNTDKTENLLQAPVTLTIKSEDYSDTEDLEVEASLVSGVGSINNAGYGVTFTNTTGNIYSFQAGTQTVIPTSIDTPAGGMIWNLTDKGIKQSDKYIITFKVKKNTDSIVGESPNLVYGLADGSMGAGWGWKAQTVYAVDVTSSEWQTVVTEATVPVDAGSSVKFILGLGVGCTRSEYNKTGFDLREGSSILVDMDSLCVVKPALKGIVNSAISSTNVYAGGTIEAKAAVVNSANLTGDLNQTIEYVVLDAATRKKPASGITVTVGENGNYTVNVSKSAAAGNYVVVASNSTNGSVMRKGLEFTVDTIDKYTTDYEPGIKPTSAAYNNFGHTCNPSSVLGFQTTYAYPNITSAAPNALDTTLNSAYLNAQDQPNIGAWMTYPTGTFEGGKTYVMSYDVTNTSDTVDTKVISAIVDSYAYINGANTVAAHDLAAGETKKITRTVTLNDGEKDSAKTYVKIGLGFGNTKYSSNSALALIPNSSISFDISTFYISEETAYDIDVTAQSSAVRAGGTMDVEAAILNQVGMEGVSLNQNFEWVALNSTKTDVVDGITVTTGADTSVATVSVDEDVAEGTYVIAAYNEEYDMAKSMVITVSNKVSVENIALDTANSKVTFDALNVPNDEFGVKVYIAEYTEAGKKLVQAEEVPVVLSKGNNIGAEAIYTKDINTDNLIKIFVWKSDLTPLAEEVEAKKN